MFRLVILFTFIGFITAAQPTNVLFVGNSYTHMNNLFKIYQNLANSKGKPARAPAAPPAAPVGRQMTALAQGEPYESLIARGWTDVTLIQNGLMLA